MILVTTKAKGQAHEQDPALDTTANRPTEEGSAPDRTTPDGTGPGHLCQDYREFLAAQAIDPAVTIADGVRCAHKRKYLPEDADDYWPQKLPGILFPWKLRGETFWQLRPDDPKGGPKYLFPEAIKVTVEPT